jgi:adenylate kinase family enzyme/tetratricopeptide (TPR) repeat protein
MWQSVLQWITLQPDQVLFIEGAEDFDIVGAGHAETVQVKDTAASGTVTLNSGSVLEAIAHFWEHQSNNPSLVVHFRFLTTSDRGMEQRAPFGAIRGLDHWDRCKHSLADLAVLRLVLLTKDALPAGLKDFISSASDTELREGLVRRITWDTGQGDHEAVIEIITRRVIGVAAQLFGAPPHESEKIIPHLLARVFEVARDQNDRRLDVADFLELLEELTTTRISKAKLRQLRSGARIDQSSLGAEGVQSEILELVPEDPRAYALPSFERLAKREHVIDNLIERMDLNGILVIRGSTGAGKSTLAALLASRGGAWRRFDMRDLEPQRIREQLVRAALADSERSQDVDYIIDDLNFDSHSSSYERALSAFLRAVTTRGGRVVLTTQGELPNRVDLAFNLPEDSHFIAPWLTEEEVEEIAIAHGCPDDRRLKSWKRIIHINTLGHPQLVHARVKNLAALSWPLPKIGDITSQEDIGKVRREVRQRLQAQLPSEEARTLAYRLDIFTLHFRREHALVVAQHPLAVSNPGEIFDVLVGPWVEQVNTKYYRLSPLLRGSAAEVFGADQVRNLHKTAAYSFLAGRKSISQFELNGALFHGILGDEAPPLDAVARNIDKIKDADWPLVAAEIDWVTYMALSAGERLFKANPFTSLMLRNLQFRVAANTSTEVLAPKVVSAWEAELNAFDEFRDNEAFLITRMAFQFFFNAIFFRTEVPIGSRTIIRNIARSVSLLRACKKSAESGDKLTQEALQSSPCGFDAVDDYVFVAAARCKDAEDVNEFIASLEEQDGIAVEPIWEQLRDNDYVGMLLISAVWLPEIKAPTPNWQRCFEVINLAIEAGSKWKADALIANAFRAKAILVKEYIPTGEDAETILAEGIKIIGYDHPVIMDYLAKIYMLDGRHAEALDVWRKIPPESDDEQSTARVFTQREAVMSAANLGEWGLAAEYAAEGERKAPKLSHLGEIVTVGFMAENAFALWRQGDLVNSIKSFACVIERLPSLPDPNNNIKSYTLHLKVLLTLKRIGNNATEEEKQIAPQSGWFTDPSSEGSIEKPAPPYIFYWYFLADAEHKAKVDGGILSRLDAEQEKSDTALANSLIELLRIKSSLRNQSVDSLVDQYGRFALSARELRSSANMPDLPTFDTGMLISMAFAALVMMGGIKRQWEIPLQKWISDAKRHGLENEELVNYFKFLERAIVAEETELLALCNDTFVLIDARLVAALLLAASENLDPANRFVTNVLLVTSESVPYQIWRDELEPTIEKLIVEGWKMTAKEQKFSLLSPRTTVPQIVSACRDESVAGLRKAARVLIAVQAAVSVRLPDDVIGRLSSVADLT